MRRRRTKLVSLSGDALRIADQLREAQAKATGNPCTYNDVLLGLAREGQHFYAALEKCQQEIQTFAAHRARWAARLAATLAAFGAFRAAQKAAGAGRKVDSIAEHWNALDPAERARALWGVYGFVCETTHENILDNPAGDIAAISADPAGGVREGDFKDIMESIQYHNKENVDDQGAKAGDRAQ